MVSHLLPLPCACTHVDTLALTALYVPTRATPYPLCLCVFIEQTLNTPDPLSALYAEGNPVSIFHHGDQACPHSFFSFSKPAPSCLFAACERDMFASEQVSSPLDKWAAQHPFHLADSLEWMLLKTRLNIAGGCQGYAGCFYPILLWCMLHRTKAKREKHLSIS